MDSGDDDPVQQRRNRQMQELLGELRVALPGVQVLLAFLLVVPFNDRFVETTAFQRDVYFVTLMATALSVACFIAPTAFHRVRFEQGDKPVLIEWGSHFAIGGLALLGIALTGVVLLVCDFVFGSTQTILATVTAAVGYFGLWFAFPLARYLR